VTKDEKETVLDKAYLAVLGQQKAFMLMATGKHESIFLEVLGPSTYSRFIRLMQGLGPMFYEGYFDVSN